MSASEEGSRRAESLLKGPNVGSWISRAAGFFAFWLALTGGDLSDLAAGVVAAIAATWASLRLMPAEQWGLRPIRIARYLLHFLHQSIAAGTDVALRALDPRLPLRPGFVVYHAHLPPGTKRNAFCAIMSLLPGTLPCGAAEDQGLAIHCLDVTEPVIEQLSREETLCVQAFGGTGHNG